MLHLRPERPPSPTVSQGPGCSDAVGLRDRADVATVPTGYLLGSGMTGTLTIPARVMNQDTQDLLDAGSVVTLLRPDLAGNRWRSPASTGIPVSMRPAMWSCGPPTEYLRPGRGSFPTYRSLLIGRDCLIFHCLWNPERGSRRRRDPPRFGRHGH